MKRLVITSDSHECPLDFVPEGDILLYAGDATYRGTIPSITQFNKEIGKLKFEHKLFTPGNHDMLFQKNPSLAESLMTNCRVVIDNLVEVDGIKIWMSPWSKQFFDWAFMAEEDELRKIYGRIPEGIDILVSHGPPYGILDQNVYDECCGSVALTEAINRVKPKYAIFGHIHEAYGMTRNKNTTFINASYVNEKYHPVNKPVVLDI